MPERPSVPEDDLHFTLLENGLDSVLESLQRLQGQPTASDLKHSSLALWLGIILVFKEVLRRKDWRLLFQDPESADSAAYATGNFFGADFGRVVKRLRDKCGVRLPRLFKRHLRGLRARRNKIEHFEIHESRDEVLAPVARLTGDLLEFVGEHIEPSGLTSTEAELVQKIRDELRRSELLLDELVAPVLEELESSGVAALECPRCHLETLALTEPVSCRLCGFRGDGGIDRAEEYVSIVLGMNKYRTVKKGGVWPQFNCFECETPAMVVTETEYGDLAACLECGAHWPAGSITWCDRCGAPMIRDDDTTTCPDCWGTIFSRDE